MEELNRKLAKFGIAELTAYPNANPELNPVDIYKSHITDHLATVTGVEPDIIFRALSWTQSLDKGDLVLAVPALRQKGKKPAELAAEYAEKVWLTSDQSPEWRC